MVCVWLKFQLLNTLLCISRWHMNICWFLWILNGFGACVMCTAYGVGANIHVNLFYGAVRSCLDTCWITVAVLLSLIDVLQYVVSGWYILCPQILHMEIGKNVERKQWVAHVFMWVAFSRWRGGCFKQWKIEPSSNFNNVGNMGGMVTNNDVYVPSWH
jgi:hypothetical protein